MFCKLQISDRIRECTLKKVDVKTKVFESEMLTIRLSFKIDSTQVDVFNVWNSSSKGQAHQKVEKVMSVLSSAFKTQERSDIIIISGDFDFRCQLEPDIAL